MNKIKTLMIAIVAMATLSCEKDKHPMEDADRIINKGETEVLVSEYVLYPNEEIIIKHREVYFVLCGRGCKVDINGYIHRETGVYDNKTSFKHRF